MYRHPSYGAIEDGRHVLPKARREPVFHGRDLVDEVVLDEVEGDDGVDGVESHLEVAQADDPVIGSGKVAPGTELDHSVNGVEELDDLLRCELTW